MSVKCLLEVLQEFQDNGDQHLKLKMTLFGATIICSLILTALGVLFWKNPSSLEDVAKELLRSSKASLILFGGATVWFLWHISQLGAADFGQYKNLIIWLLGGVSIGSFFFVRDFLAVRGLGVLLLLSSQLLLESAYLEEPKSKLFLVLFAYLAILLGLYLGTVPFRLRDYFNWLFSSQIRLKLFGGVMGVYGILLAIAAFTY